MLLFVGKWVQLHRIFFSLCHCLASHSFRDRLWTFYSHWHGEAVGIDWSHGVNGSGKGLWHNEFVIQHRRVERAGKGRPLEKYEAGGNFLSYAVCYYFKKSVIGLKSKRKENTYPSIAGFLCLFILTTKIQWHTTVWPLSSWTADKTENQSKQLLWWVSSYHTGVFFHLNFKGSSTFSSFKRLEQG